MAGATLFESTVVARSSGRLFLYVNDAVDLLGWRGFYDNNGGCARVSVLALVPPASSAVAPR
jgi:hypothetical protein